jgi:hypothetical protein
MFRVGTLRIYAMGGQLLKQEGCSNQVRVEAWDPDTNTWEIRASLPHGLGHIAPATISTPHGIVVVGGAKDRSGGSCSPPGAHPNQVSRAVKACAHARLGCICKRGGGGGAV